VALCPRCFSEMEACATSFVLEGAKGIYLYEYNEVIRSKLFLLKGCGDVEVASIFLSYQKPFLQLLFRGYSIVPAPSFAERDRQRGFNHVVEIFRTLGLPMLFPLIKNAEVKQADRGAEERKLIGEYLAYDEKVSVKGLRILFVDDVLTSGATASACLRLLRARGALEVRLLIMAKTIDKQGGL
jgi:competence protein ComFC